MTGEETEAQSCTAAPGCEAPQCGPTATAASLHPPTPAPASLPYTWPGAPLTSAVSFHKRELASSGQHHSDWRLSLLRAPETSTPGDGGFVFFLRSQWVCPDNQPLARLPAAAPSPRQKLRRASRLVCVEQIPPPDEAEGPTMALSILSEQLCIQRPRKVTVGWDPFWG